MADERYQSASRRRLRKVVRKPTAGPGPTPPTPAGQLLFDVDYAAGNLNEWIGVLGGPVGGYMPTMTNVDPYKGGWSAQLDLPVNTSGSHRSEFGVLEPYDFTMSETAFPMFVHRYWGTAIKLPADWNWACTGNDGWGVQLCQWDMNDIWGAPVGIRLDDHRGSLSRAVNLSLMSGVSSFGGSQYSNGPGGNLPEVAAVPAASIVLGQWLEIIVHSFRTNAAYPGNGIVESWWKYRGQTTWNAGGTIVGYPTMEWWAGDSTPQGRPDAAHPNSLSVKWGVYRSPSSLPLRMYHGLAVAATTFEMAASRFV